jgi:hypothetical protein
LNAEEVQDRALAFAARLLKENRNESEIIKRAFELALGRAAGKEEVELCVTHWKIATRSESQKNPVAPSFPKKIKRTVMAEKTGEPYDFWEFLPAFESYQPDLQRSDTDARTRGLAHVCLVLFNSNEFAYLD